MSATDWTKVREDIDRQANIAAEAFRQIAEAFNRLTDAVDALAAAHQPGEDR